MNSIVQDNNINNQGIISKIIVLLIDNINRNNIQSLTYPVINRILNKLEMMMTIIMKMFTKIMVIIII